ncbi:hypothetical protein [Candidatus Solirubrobacter pratensis]|uniref:hypothetical protein n=1 Tax=Candidatus Solirubrobacter pratensis TaxID=1298857 RepID=UPI00041F0622|nr:hypothetical protein [Candidatus Solirubrobacter pratensis]
MTLDTHGRVLEHVVIAAGQPFPHPSLGQAILFIQQCWQVGIPAHLSHCRFGAERLNYSPDALRMLSL